MPSGPERGGGWWPGDSEEGSSDGGPAEPTPEREQGEKPPGKRPRGLATPGAPKPASRYSLVVGLAFVAIVVLALFNLLGNDDDGILGVSSEGAGLALPEFAVADARGDSEADANVAQDDCETSRNPCPEEDQRLPACEITTADALRVCDLFDKPAAISFWFTRGGDCLPSQDAFDEVATRFAGRAEFLSVNVRDERDTVAEIVGERGWDVPVGLDPDGAVSNLYRVGGCPTIVYSYPGGILYKAEIGAVTSEQVDAQVEDLLRASAAREGRTR